MKYDILTVLSLTVAIVIALIAVRLIVPLIVMLTGRFSRLFQGKSVI